MTASSRHSVRLVVGVEFGRIDAGIIRDGRWEVCESRRENAVEGLAPLLRDVLGRGDLHPLEATEWIYSGGPGSLLSLRALAMMLESWAALGETPEIPRRRYSGMVWTARHLLKNATAPPFTLISPWRTGAWNLLAVNGGATAPTAADLAVAEGMPAPGDRTYCIGSRPGSRPPEGAGTVGLPEFPTLLEEISDDTFLRSTPTVQPIQSGTTTYRRWEPKPHSAP